MNHHPAVSLPPDGGAPWQGFRCRLRKPATAQLEIHSIVIAALVLAMVTVLCVASKVEFSKPPVPVRVVYQDMASEAVVCGVTSIECVPMNYSSDEPEQERVVGAYSLPANLRDNFRFAQNGDGDLVLRIVDRCDYRWRNATVDDLSLPVVDMTALRHRARGDANSRGSGMTTDAAFRQILRQTTPPLVTAYSMPQSYAARVPIMANFYVTDGLPKIQSAPILDWIDCDGDPIKMMGKSIARKAGGVI